ncbi:MAG TPA: glutaminyl-peptide cyclotransferase [Candidatus Acidoferrales bacterium]|jgi:glutamine cyclotransferase|nr:glutaminyl-peptide cyclotransferase [Candidatus Acidoferrales bacterium]
MRLPSICFALLVLAMPMLQPARKNRHGSVPEYSYRIVNSFPHDPQAYTQGLVYKDGFFYEGTGLTGRSSLRRAGLETGEVLQRVDLAPEFFGEGITLLGGKIFQLTWKAHTGFIYDARDFRQLGRFSYAGEGWGLTTDGHDLYMSDGTPEIRVLDPVTLMEKRRIRVHDGAIPVQELNELEYINGEIFANVWQTDKIARISPRTGKIVGWIDLAGILSPVYRRTPDAVLNGIAYDSKGKRLFVTGKLWPSIFEIQLIPKP